MALKNNSQNPDPVKIMWEHETFYYQNILASYTRKSFCLPMKRSREMKWFSQCHRLLWQWAITSFPSVTETSQAPGTLPVLPPLPPACCWNTLCPDHRWLLEHSPFIPKFLLLKLCPTGSIRKKKYYWGHSLYTWMSPPGSSGSDGTCGEPVVMCWHLT